MTQNTLRQLTPVTMEARPGWSVGDGHPIRNTAAVLLGVLLCVFAAQSPRVASARGHDGTPPEFNAVACYQLVQDAGRPIAWARWEKGLSVEKTGLQSSATTRPYGRSTWFRNGSPTPTSGMQAMNRSGSGRPS